jgi:hypothetical protein
LWDRWACGDTLNVKRLGDIAEQLTTISSRTEHTEQFHALGQAMRDWADDAGIDLPTTARRRQSLERGGPELGL